MPHIRKKKWIVLITVVFVGFFVFFSSPTHADETQEKLNQLNDKIKEYQSELIRLNTQTNTLSNQVAQYDAQINLTELKISQTEQEIALLGGRIDLLEDSLTSLTKAFTSRAIKTYKLARFSGVHSLILTTNSVDNAVSSLYYLEKIQRADSDLLLRLEAVQTDYISEKSDQETLQNELEEQRNVLGVQKSSKSKLLNITRNDEKKYQQLISQARAELEAIQSIIAGKGKETMARTVSAGERIASVIPGVSACSSGAHLHFEVAKGGINQNPAQYLASKDVIWDNSPDGPFGFSGNWQWPLNDSVRITQGFGMTYYAASLRYYGGAPHTGIDMVNANQDWTVKSAQAGTLYQGAIACGGGTLRYVRVEQADDIDTYYLHVNY